MSPALFRLLTMTLGTVMIIAGALLPAGREVLLATGGAVVGWAIRHPADKP